MADANLLEIILRARDQTKAAFASAKKGIAATKTATGGLSQKLGGLNKGFGAVSGKVSGFGTKLEGLMTSAIGPLIGVMGIAAVTMALKKSVDAFGSFEQAAANASSVTGKTGAAFLETKGHIMEVSKVLGETTVFKASEAADAFYDLASAGYDVANITKTELKPILDLAAASQTDLKATTELVTSTLGQFGMGIESSKKVADVFARTIGSSKATMEKLGNSMVYVGPVAHALGRSLEETSATLGVLYNKGFDASMAGTALRGALSRLMNPTAQVAAKLSELGVTVAEVNPETHSMADILDTLTGAGMDTADAMELFGLRAGPAMLALTENTDDIRELTGSLGEAGGAAETMASQQLTTFEGQMKLVHSKIEAFMLNIGEMTAPAVLAMANALTDHVLPALETLYTEISTGFGEAFESIGRQAGPALAPLSEKIKEVSDKMSAGLDFKTLADDVGVFVGAALNPLIQAFTWLIDKLGPVWDLIGRGSEIFHSLANALKTEEGRLDDIRDATEEVSAAKQTLFDINEKLREATKTLADEIRDAGGWTESLSALELDAKTNTDALAEARKAATTAIAEHGAGSEIARAAIEKVKIAEEEAKTSTENYQAALDTSAAKFIDAGVATEGLQQAHVDLETASNASLTAQENLQTAISDLAAEIEESKQAPFDLGEAFGNFGTKVKEIFFEIPLRIAEAFVKINETVADVFSDLGTKISEFGDKVPDFLGGDFIKGVGASFEAVSDNFDTSAADIESRVKEIRDSFEENLEEPLKDGVAEASEAAAEAVDDAMSAIVESSENAGDAVDELKDKTEVLGEESVAAGETAEEAYEGIELQVGDTEISIEKLSGGLGDNVDAFEDMKDAAKKLMDLDWSVFTEFEAALPNIEAGIMDMESSFVGLRDILQDNIGSLENVKESVMDISDIAAPFIEEGFLNGIESIGSFAGSLKAAGSAINDFSSLQDVSIDGCINFSLHVHDMVSALEVLESQMEDLVPAFGDMDSLITDIADAFLYSDGKLDVFTDTFSDAMTSVNDDLSATGISFEDFKNISDKALDVGFITYGSKLESGARTWLTHTVNTIKDVEFAITQAQRDMGEVILAEDAYLSRHGFYWFDEYKGEITNWGDISTRTYGDVTKAMRSFVRENYGVTVSMDDMYKVMQKTPEGQEEWFQNMARSNAALTFQMNKQTNALKSQNEQLSKITDSLQPYLEFMRTLNELAALSTLSTEELNAGLNSINDTLVNLGSALNTFDLRSTMESLFGTKISAGEFTGGVATGFTDVMIEYQTEFDNLIVYVTRLSSAIMGLTAAFDALANISESVLADQTKIKEVFEGITTVMTNFSTEMGGAEGIEGFAQKFADGMDAMIKSVDPLIIYFQKNNAAVDLFNSTLNTFKTTISNVVDTMDLLKDMSEMALPSVEELGAGFDRAKEFVDNFDDALMRHIGLTRGDKAFTYDDENGLIQSYENNKYSLEKLFDNLFTSITRFADDWIRIEEEMGDSFKTFERGTKTITDMITTITSLTEAFKTLEDMPLLTSDQILLSFEKIKDSINEVNKAMVTFAEEGLSELVTSLASIETQWTEWDTKIGDSDDTFADAVTSVTTLVSALTSLLDVQKQLESLEGVSDTEWTAFFKTISDQAHEFGEGMARFTVEGGLTSLANNLGNVEVVWTAWTEKMGDSLKIFNEASSSISGLASSVSGLVTAFVSLAEMPVMTEKVFSTGMKRMSINIKNFAAALKSNIGTIEETLEAVDDAWSDHADNMEKLVPIFKDATTAINTLTGGIMSVVRSFESLKEVDFEKEFTIGFKNLTKATNSFATALANNIGGLVHSLDRLVSTWMENEDETVKLMRGFIIIAQNFMIVIGYANMLQDAFGNMTAKTSTLGKGFDELIEFMNAVIKGVKEIYTTEGADDLARFVIDVGLVVDAMVSLEESMESTMSKIRTKINTTVDDLKTKVSALGTIAKSGFWWGVTLLTTFVAGIHSMRWLLRAELSGIAGIIAEYLAVGSNTKLGALSHLTDWPENLVKTFADGIKKGTPELSKALSALTLPAEHLHMPAGYAGMLGGKGNTLTMYNTWHVENKEDADYAVEQIETLLTRRSVI